MKPEELDALFRAKLEDHQGAPKLPAWSRLEEKLQQPKAEHSVDELFRRKLENHPTPLPESVWTRLEERMNPGQTKTRPMWVWYAAACIVMLLSVTGLWKYQFSQQPQLAVQAPVTSPAPQSEATVQPNQQNNTIEHTITTQPTIAAAENTASTPANQLESTVSGKKESTYAVQPATEQHQLAVAAPKARAEARGTAAAKTSEARNQPDQQRTGANTVTPAIEPETELAVPAENTGPVVIGAPQLAVAEPLKVEIILASEAEIQQPEPQTQEEQDRDSLLKRVAKNLLKLKNGEKPDLQDLGLAQSYTMRIKTRTQTLSKTINL